MPAHTAASGIELPTKDAGAVRRWLWKTQGPRIAGLFLPLLGMVVATVGLNLEPRSSTFFGLSICLGFYLMFAIPYLGGSLFYSLSACSRNATRGFLVFYLVLPIALLSLESVLGERARRMNLGAAVGLGLLMLITGLVLLAAHATRQQASAADIAISHLRDQNLPRALDYAKLAGALGGDDADAVRSLALNFANGGQADLALKLSDTLTQYGANNANNWRAHAHFCHRAGKADEAWRAFDQALRLEPKNADIYYDRGVQRVAVGGNNKNALADYTHAIRLAPKNAKFLANRAGLHMMMGNPDLAKIDAAAALALDPNDPVARNVISRT